MGVSRSNAASGGQKNSVAFLSSVRTTSRRIMGSSCKIHQTSSPPDDRRTHIYIRGIGHTTRQNLSLPKFTALDASDPNDLTTLTPGHFITGGLIRPPPEPPLTLVPTNRLGAWQKIEQLNQQFWNRWSQEYLIEQQKRTKWARPQRPFQENDLVLIRSDVTAPCHWAMGRVVSVFISRDGYGRVCEVRTKSGTVVRPITKLCLLPMEQCNNKTSEAGFP